MPTRNETKQFKMLSNEALNKFRIFCAAGRYPRPAGAYDSTAGIKPSGDPKTDALLLLKEFLIGKLSPEEMSEVETMCKGALSGRIKNTGEGRIYPPDDPERGAHDGNNYEWAANWAREKGMSEDDISEFVEGLQQHGSGAEPPAFAGQPLVGGGQRPLNAQDRKRKMAADARMAAASSNRASFARRYPGVRMEPSTSDSVGALRGHMSKIGVV